jgi:hypothetical protein
MTELWVWSVTAARSRGGSATPRRSRMRCRAATSADRLPTVPPCTKQPPASAGRPTRSAIQRSAWFSA